MKAIAIPLVVTLAGILLSACSSTAPGDEPRFTPEVVEVIGDPGSALLEFGVDTCNQDPTVAIVESPTEVRFTVTATRVDGDRDDCLDSVVVTLHEPLGDRAIVNEVAEITWTITP